MGKNTWMERVIDTQKMYPNIPRGYRNNNPLNIRFSTRNDWQGQLGRDKGDMCVFYDMKYGVRAAIKLIANYQWRYNKRTVLDIITRWAPKKENNTDAYIKRVCDWMKCEPWFIPRFGLNDEQGDCCRMIQAMMMVENGVLRTDLCSWRTIQDAYEMAFPGLRPFFSCNAPDIAEALPENGEVEEERVFITYYEAFMEDRNSHFGIV